MIASLVILLLLGISATHGLLKPSYTNRRGTTSLKLIEYGPEFQPVQAITTAAILTTFFFVQSRITKSNNLLESLRVAKEDMKKARNEMMSGTNADAKVDIANLETKIAQIESEWTDTATFIKLPNYTLRFRVLRPDLVPGNEAEVDPNDASSDAGAGGVSANNNSNSFKNNGQDIQERFNFSEMTPSQVGLVLVGGVVVVVQFWLLTLLSVDPMSSSNSIATFSAF